MEKSLRRSGSAMNKKPFFMLLLIVLSISAIIFIPEWLHSTKALSVSSIETKTVRTVPDTQSIPDGSDVRFRADPDQITQLFLGKPAAVPLPDQKIVKAKTTPAKPEEQPTFVRENTTTTLPPIESEVVPSTTTTTLAPLPIVKAPYLRMIGKITDGDDITRFFFRNEQTGKILRVREDGVLENGVKMNAANQTSFFIEFDGKIYECGKR